MGCAPTATPERLMRPMKTPRLWIETAHETWLGPADEEAGAIVRSLSTENRTLALLAHGEGWAIPTARAALFAAWQALSAGAGLAPVVERLVAALPDGAHLPWAALDAGPLSDEGSRLVQLVECDAPPMFYARRGEVVLLPVVEDEAHGRLLRRCDFQVRDGDYLALVSESTIRARGDRRPWSWRNIALSVRRLTSTGGSAEDLAGALLRIGNQRTPALAPERSAGASVSESANLKEYHLPSTIRHSSFAVLAMRVRPMRSVTVWSGPPADRRRDQEALAKLLVEEGDRVICGDTTAEIAARLLGGRLEMAPPPPEGWAEVPPMLRLTEAAARVDLITEGAVTLRVAQQRLAETQRPRDLAGRLDGASRLAKLLLEADKITFLLGLAVNPAQTERDGTPLRKAAVEKLIQILRTHEKLVSVEEV